MRINDVKIQLDFVNITSVGRESGLFGVAGRIIQIGSFQGTNCPSDCYSFYLKYHIFMWISFLYFTLIFIANMFFFVTTYQIGQRLINLIAVILCFFSRICLFIRSAGVPQNERRRQRAVYRS